MTNHRDLFYLRSDIQFEPLVDNWYAWSYLIPPATAARNMTQRHFKIMDSYIAAPEMHAIAVKNPKLLGGPFVDYGFNRVDEVRGLRKTTLEKRQNLLNLSRSLEEIELVLADQTGFSFKPIYARVPEELRGYIELIYDLNHRPSYRLLESLLYRSKYYDPVSQSVMLSICGGDDRPFVLSTPRFESDDALQLAIQFSDIRIDSLFRLKLEPSTLSSIADSLGVPAPHCALFKSFLTLCGPRKYQKYDGPGARWRYFGHACILLELGSISILIDPVLSYTYDSTMSRYTYLDLPDKIDYVLITHNHQDHILFETLLQIRHKVGTIIVPRNSGGFLQDPSLKLILQNCGFKDVIELDELDSIGIPNGEVVGIPFLGEHADLNVRTKSAYLIRYRQHTLLFAADSCNLEDRLYTHIHDTIGDVDVLFLGMECDGAPLSWLYGPLLINGVDRQKDESRRLAGSDSREALGVIAALNCKEVYVYAMGQEPWLNYIMSLKYTPDSRPIIESNAMIESCRKTGIHAERLFGEKEILLD